MTYRETITETQAARIAEEHGMEWSIVDAADGNEAFYLHIPWSMADGNGGFRTGTDVEHVSDFGPTAGRISLRALRDALGY